MRTTLTLDDDVLARARQIAEATGRTLGQVISDLTRQSMNAGTASNDVRNGVVLLPLTQHGRQASLEDVNRLRDDLS